eukprot:scaffold17_cov124-Isochrysis_galbana.AAC.1
MLCPPHAGAFWRRTARMFRRVQGAGALRSAGSKGPCAGPQGPAQDPAEHPSRTARMRAGRSTAIKFYRRNSERVGAAGVSDDSQRRE